MHLRPWVSILFSRSTLFFFPFKRICEGTTIGVHSLYEMFKIYKLKIPITSINNSFTKSKFMAILENMPNLWKVSALVPSSSWLTPSMPYRSAPEDAGWPPWKKLAPEPTSSSPTSTTRSRPTSSPGGSLLHEEWNALDHSKWGKTDRSWLCFGTPFFCYVQLILKSVPGTDWAVMQPWQAPQWKK